MFKLDDAAIEKWIRGQKISTDRIPAAAAARRAWLLRKAGGAANAALQARRMFAKARAVKATGDVHLGTAAERQCRRLERRLVRKERKERIKRARAALALDGGLDADEADVEVVNALAGYGAGGLQRPLKEKDIRIKSWGHGLLKILEREADSDDDDGGVEGTETKFEAVRNVEAEVVAPLELVVFDGAEPRAESAYVVKAEQVVRFEVRPANADGESGTRDPREVGKKRDDRKRKDEKKKADERQTAERQARKAMRAKHAVGARVVLDPEIVQKYGSRDTLTEDCWGTITRIDGERARLAWDAGTPEARSGKTSFPLEVTAPRIIGRGATVLQRGDSRRRRARRQKGDRGRRGCDPGRAHQSARRAEGRVCETMARRTRPLCLPRTRRSRTRRSRGASDRSRTCGVRSSTARTASSASSEHRRGAALASWKGVGGSG